MKLGTRQHHDVLVKARNKNKLRRGKTNNLVMRSLISAYASAQSDQSSLKKVQVGP